MPKRRGAFGTTGQTSAGSWWARYTYNATMHRPGHTFASRELADAWLSGERRLIDLDTWTPPADRRAAAKAEALMETTTLHAFATEWIAKRVTRRGEPFILGPGRTTGSTSTGCWRRWRASPSAGSLRPT